MAKCDICGGKIETTFLKKIQGTIVKDKNGKQKHVCPNCQKQNKDADLKELVS